jgi:aspartate aminotransferase
VKSHFSRVAKAPIDSILGLTAAFEEDLRQEKVNLSVGVYKTEEGKIPVLASVKHAEKLLWEVETTKNYLPIEGDLSYLKEAFSLILGKSLFQEVQKKLSLLQTIGGCGALRLAGEFIRKEISSSIYISEPSWPNHQGIFSQCGLEVKRYPYYDLTEKKVFFDQMIHSLSMLPSASVILFHVNCHNPSGADLEMHQWEEVAELCRQKGLIPLFDAAYLGFDQGFEEDAFPVRLFVKKEIEFFLAVSFSKNFSLYAERVGGLCIFSSNANKEAILSQCKGYIRRNYSNPCLHGAKVVSIILREPFLKKMWEEELSSMRQRIAQIKQTLVRELMQAQSEKDYSYFLDRKGLFSFCDFSIQQIDRLQKEYAIYLTIDSRMNIAGLTKDNIPYVVKSFVEARKGT